MKVFWKFIFWLKFILLILGESFSLLWEEYFDTLILVLFFFALDFRGLPNFFFIFFVDFLIEYVGVLSMDLLISSFTSVLFWFFNLGFFSSFFNFCFSLYLFSASFINIFLSFWSIFSPDFKIFNSLSSSIFNNLLVFLALFCFLIFLCFFSLESSFFSWFLLLLFDLTDFFSSFFTLTFSNIFFFVFSGVFLLLIVISFSLSILSSFIFSFSSSIFYVFSLFSLSLDFFPNFKDFIIGNSFSFSW